MNVRRFRAKLLLGLITIAVAGGLTTNWQSSSRLLAKPPKETLRFTVTTPDPDPNFNLEIVGVFVDGVNDWSGEAEGRADRDRVIVNRPSPAVRMDFLVDDGSGDPTPFETGEIYSIDGSGSMGIHDSNKGAGFTYFFRGPGWEEGSVVHYRLDGDAIIMGSGFPDGDPDGYTVVVSNLYVSQDTGKRGNAYEGGFPFATAVFHLQPQ